LPRLVALCFDAEHHVFRRRKQMVSRRFAGRRTLPSGAADAPERGTPAGRRRTGHAGRRPRAGVLAGTGGARETGEMTVLVWVTENTWKACVDAARSLTPDGEDVALLTVVDTGTAETAHGAFSGMLGRAGQDPARRLSARAEEAANDLLDAAEARLGRPADRLRVRGHGTHEVVTAAQDATMLIVARDGPGGGPKSLGKEVRFVVDHALCPVLLVWPGPPKPVPPPPRHDAPPPPHDHGPHERGPHGPGQHGRGPRPHEPGRGPHDRP